ncbi:MAG TPA: exodeoxyribonuclease VII large subunit [Methanocorpusculum sp.]|nr:exodeoxyribonuclease VII large subunit [Methanocorpusculum sp.]
MAKKQTSAEGMASLFDFSDNQSSASAIEPVKENSALEVQEEKILGVLELTGKIRDVLDCDALTDVKVQGEVTGYRPNASGHQYFSLSEKGDKDAVISCVMWKFAAAKNLPFPLKDGLSIIACGSVDYYPPSGRTQLIVKKVEPSRKGVSGLYLQKEIWKKEMTDAGIIPRPDSEKRSLPLFPKKIGVVTSKTGSVLQDIRNVVSRRFPLEILLAPASVQGSGAEFEIAAAIASLQGKVEVIIVARGGGSFEDLFVFNNPVVVKAIRASNVPVISAIGHETDTTLSDYASDLRVPTPSAAAESVVPDRNVMLRSLEESRRAIHDKTEGIILANREMLADLRGRVDPKRLQRKLDEMQAQTADFEERLGAAFVRKIRMAREDLIRAGELICRSSLTAVSRAKLELAAQKEVISARDPEKPLKLGYALVYRGGSVVKSVKDAKVSEKLTLQLADGRIETTVEKIL